MSSLKKTPLKSVCLTFKPAGRHQRSSVPSVSPPELLHRWSGLHPEEEEGVSGRFAATEQQRWQAELQAQSSLQRAGGRRGARYMVAQLSRKHHGVRDAAVVSRFQCFASDGFWWLVCPCDARRRGRWRLLPHPAAAVSGDGGDQRRWDGPLLHPSGHLLQHLHRLRAKRWLLRDKHTRFLRRTWKLASPLDLKDSPSWCPRCDGRLCLALRMEELTGMKSSVWDQCDWHWSALTYWDFF